MRVAYLLTWSGDQRTGVFKKVVDQVSAWADHGVEAGIFVATTPTSRAAWQSVPEVVHTEVFDSALGSFSAQHPLIKALRRWGPDITYVRTSPRQFVVSRALGQLPHAIEIQTDDIAEARGLSPARYALTLATRRRCLGGARGLVFVSRELAALPSYDAFSARRIVIGNGIDLHRVEPLPPADNIAPRLAFMGLPGIPWHGLDDLLALAAQRPAWRFDLIGPSSTDLELPSNVTAHGELPASDYRPILENADAAVSTLALYRNRMNEASPLKSREYLALGLPVIGGYEDTDVAEGSDVYLRLPNRPRALLDEQDRVEAFLAHWRGRRVPREAIAYLDASAKEAQRLDFLRGLR